MRPSGSAGVFVGRTHELDVLREALVDVRVGGRGRACLVEGEAGIGKTRLVEELLAWAEGRGFDVVRSDPPCVRMERLWGLAVATRGNRWQIRTSRKRLRQPKTVAVGCDRLSQVV